MSAPRTIRNPWSLALLAIATTLVAGCQVKYRHEVEAPDTPAQYTYSAGGFIRYDGYGDVAGDLEIASVDFRRPGSEVVVRLTGVIHIGDLNYYRELQRECLDTADVVLFEGVKMEGEDEAPAPKPSDKKNEKGLGDLYETMGKLLGVGFQKDGIDYNRANFVHCDVTIARDDPIAGQVDTDQIGQALQLKGPLVQFKQMMAQGPDGVRMEDAFKHQMVSMMAMQMGGVDDEELLAKIRGQSKKDIPAPMQERAERAAEALKGLPVLPGMGMPEEMKEQILDRRNDYVVEQLKARLAKEDHSKPQVVAIFYGAAHNQGIAASLKEMGYEPVATTWLRAWSMNSRGQSVVSERSDGAAPLPSTPAATPAREAKKKGDLVLF